MKIITGATGETHVTSNNDGEFNQAIFGDGLVVLSNGNKLAATITNNNLITVKDGDLVFQGRHALIEPGTTDELVIETGTVDVNRNDLIVAQYKIDSATGYESLNLVVKKGTETAGTAEDPALTTGTIRTGATLAEVALYRVKIEGISIKSLEKLFTETSTISAQISKNATDISSVNENLTTLTDYSTDEVAISKWIDGKTIYRKYISGTISTYTQTNKRRLFKTALISNVDTFVTFKGTVRFGSETFSTYVPFTSGASDMSTLYKTVVGYVQDGAIIIEALTNSDLGFPSVDFNLVLEYTKK